LKKWSECDVLPLDIPKLEHAMKGIATGKATDALDLLAHVATAAGATPTRTGGTVARRLF